MASLLLTKTVRGNARSLGKADGNKLLSVVLYRRSEEL